MDKIEVTKVELERALNNEGNTVKVRDTEVARYDIYAALGFMGATDSETITFVDDCPCFPGSKCFPACTE
jgi:hypothetical protein